MVLIWTFCEGCGDRISALSIKETPLQYYIQLQYSIFLVLVCYVIIREFVICQAEKNDGENSQMG